MTDDLVFRALADPHRRRLLDRLHTHDGLTVTALAVRMPMTRQAVSQHLQLLEAANLVTTVVRGREKLHFLNPVPIHAAFDRWIRKFERPRLAALGKLKTDLEGAADGPARVQVRDLHPHHRRRRVAGVGRR